MRILGNSAASPRPPPQRKMARTKKRKASALVTFASDELNFGNQPTLRLEFRVQGSGFRV